MSVTRKPIWVNAYARSIILVETEIMDTKNLKNKGYLSIVLNTHLPYVRHPEYEFFLEENWFFEAVTECYIPIIHTLDKLLSEAIPVRLTISFTPSLLSMMSEELLLSRCRRYIQTRVKLAESEILRTRDNSEQNHIAKFYYKRYSEIYETFVNTYNLDLLSAFRKFEENGLIETITSSATHCFLPNFYSYPSAIRAQIEVGYNTHRRLLGVEPKGIWLPECAYFPNLCEIFDNYDIRYFFLDTHGLMHSTPQPLYGVYAPIYTQNGVAAFGRDPESSKQVWSSLEGYPGDHHYREFYRDIGYDLDFNYIKDFIHPDGIRISTGLKYYRITGKVELSNKEFYNPEIALNKAIEHAGNFMFNREQQVEFLYEKLGKPPIIVATYDTELFGHWWFEGPDWLYYLIKKVHYNQNLFKLVTASDYLIEHPVNQMSSPHLSTWGNKGYSDVWIEGTNDWIYRHLHKATERMVELAASYEPKDTLLTRALNQAARELLLAQGSDWPFIMKTGTMVSYATKRIKSHILRFNRLYFEIIDGSIDELWLKLIESRDNIFPDIDYRLFRETQ